jgi:pimeloyl-ACP methyl ester carboxylesterase
MTAQPSTDPTSGQARRTKKPPKTHTLATGSLQIRYEPFDKPHPEIENYRMPDSQHTRDSTTRRSLLRASTLLLLPMIGLAWVVPSCQSRIIYYPRPYPPTATTQWKTDTGGKFIDFKTSQGNQRAFLQGNLLQPRNIWIVCGGNGSLALDWSEWLQTHGPAGDAWLLVDFPGYGDCQGKASPATLRETFQTVIPRAWSALGWKTPVDPGRLRFFGHSLGAASCLIAASEMNIRKGVLLAPFTSTMEMADATTGLPLGCLVVHRFDNQARLNEIASRGTGHVTIIHGTEDEVIPVSMGRKLAQSNPDFTDIREVPRGRHNDIPETHPDVIARALRDIGNP